MIAWKDMDERERAVWSATVAVHFTSFFRDQQSDVIRMSYATNLADRAVYALRDQAKKGPYR